MNIANLFTQLQDWVTNSKFWSTKVAAAGTFGGLLAEELVKCPNSDVNLKVGLAMALAVLGVGFFVAQAIEKKYTAPVTTPQG